MTDPDFCPPADNSLLRQWSPPRGKVLLLGLPWVTCVVHAFRFPPSIFPSPPVLPVLLPTSPLSSMNWHHRHITPHRASEGTSEERRVSELDVAKRTISRMSCHAVRCHPSGGILLTSESACALLFFCTALWKSSVTMAISFYLMVLHYP
ncbi:hypothetical protein B0H10DRAFT_1949299 [Mycena sp. CBHHK59/15]|nr:hypothetical protein B0H10DRAFT_1949299 [Mycena sp. CBHHK59/15]